MIYLNFNQNYNKQLQMLQNPLTAVLPNDQADLILIMIICIPLSYILSLVYNKYLFLALSMTLTIGFQSLLFPTQKWILWGQQQMVYLLIILAPRKYVGHIVLAQSFLVLTGVQLDRLYEAYGQNNFDITGILCMQIFNYIGLAYNYQRGGESPDKFTNQQLQRRLVDRPHYLTYLGYVNFLPASMVGPVYQFSDFQSYLNRTGDYSNIPSTIPAIFKELGIFIFSIVLYFGTAIFPISTITSPEFTQYNYGYKLLYIVLCITHIELKYVCAWSLGMAGMRASGITYLPNKSKEYDQKSYGFGRIQANNMTKFYLEPNMKVKADNWNISVQWALRRYIYENLYNPKDFTDEKKRKQKQFKAQLGTVLVSALWHGVYPGYYISFVHWIIYIQIEQQVYRLKKIQGTSVHQAHRKYPKLMNIVDNCLSTFVLTFYGMAFHLMTWTNIWIYLKQTLFLPYIALYLAFYLVVKMRILSKRSKSKKQTVQNTINQKAQ